MFVWLLVLCVCLCCCFGSFFVCFELSHSLLFTQKLWRFSGLSERALDLLLGLCLGVPSISRLFNLDCRYPRDQLQPARKKKIAIFLLGLEFGLDLRKILSNVFAGFDWSR